MPLKWEYLFRSYLVCFIVGLVGMWMVW